MNDDRIVHFNDSIRSMLGLTSIHKDQKVTEFNMEIHTNNNGLTSHNNATQKESKTTASIFDLRQTFANFLQGLGGSIVSGNKESEALRNYSRAEVRFGSKIVSCMRREIEFMS